MTVLQIHRPPNDLQQVCLSFSVGSPALNWQWPTDSMYLWISEGQTSATVSQIQPSMAWMILQFQVPLEANKKLQQYVRILELVLTNEQIHIASNKTAKK